MTFKEAVRNLDAEGVFGAKRPSMLGYAFKETAVDNEQETQETSVNIVAKDGSSISFKLVIDERRETRGVKDISSVALTDELATALVFAEDWELARRDELEKARTGEGTM